MKKITANRSDRLADSGIGPHRFRIGQHPIQKVGGVLKQLTAMAAAP